LFLGQCEDIGDLGDRFAPVDPKTKVFRRIGNSSRRESPGTLLAGTLDDPVSHFPEGAQVDRLARSQTTSLFQGLLLAGVVSHVIGSRDRERHSRALVELSQCALRGCDLDCLFHGAITEITDILQLDFCSVLELVPDSNALLFRSGVACNENWRGIMMPVQTGWQNDFILRSDSPVIVENLGKENRFRG
jgi:hypothetical protein